MEDQIVAGIDFGTNTISVAVLKNGEIVLKLNSQKHPELKPYVSFGESPYIFGQKAKKKLLSNPKNTVFAIKKLLGVDFEKAVHEKEKLYLPYNIESKEVAGELRPIISVEHGEEKLNFRPEEIAAMFLENIKQYAERKLNCRICETVIGVPGNYNCHQRKAMIESAKIAGFTNVNLVNESTAMVLSFSMENEDKDSNNIMAIDIGAGYTEISSSKISSTKLTMEYTRLEDLSLMLCDSQLIEMCQKFIEKHFPEMNASNSNLKFIENLRNYVVQCKINYFNNKKVSHVLFDQSSFDSVKLDLTDVFHQYFKSIKTITRESINKMKRLKNLKTVLLHGSLTQTICFNEFLKPIISSCEMISFHNNIHVGAAYYGITNNEYIVQETKHRVFHYSKEGDPNWKYLDLHKVECPVTLELSPGKYLFSESDERNENTISIGSTEVSVQESGNSNAESMKVEIEIDKNGFLRVNSLEDISTHDYKIESSLVCPVEEETDEVDWNEQSVRSEATVSTSSAILSDFAEPKEVTLGIDIGSSKWCIALSQQGQIMVMENDSGQRTTASSVLVKKLHGLEEKNASMLQKSYVIQNVKKKLAESTLYADTSFGEPIQGDTNDLNPIRIVSKLLKYFSAYVENKYNCIAKKVVLTVPNYFNSGQRRALLEAAKLADLTVLSLLNETTATAIAFKDTKTEIPHDITALIFDMGSEGMSASVVKISHESLEVLSIGGKPGKAGAYFDTKLKEHFQDEIESTNGYDLTSNDDAVENLGAGCEEGKKRLTMSKLDQQEISIDNLIGNEDFKSSINISIFEELIQWDLRNSMYNVLKETLSNASKLPKHINEVVLVGGSTQIPLVRKIFADVFTRSEINVNLNAMESVAVGAALYSNFSQSIITDIVPYNFFGISTNYQKTCRVNLEGDRVFIDKYGIVTLSPCTKPKKKLNVHIMREKDIYDE